MLVPHHKTNRKLAAFVLSLMFICGASANSLPLLGDYSSSIISLNTEYNLGQGLIRQIRGAKQSVNDPIVEAYVRDLSLELVPSSQLSDKRISLVVIGNLSVNAFAAPGGVLGIHAGLILTAHSEAELASVISHELAHLSQRHFAAHLDHQRTSTPLAIASMLTGILIAVADPEAGSAVIAGTTAQQISANLAFSRKNEQEADHIGMLTLAKAGYDPAAMPLMFSRLLELQRLQGSTPPDFLLTHPSSSARVADSTNRAAALTKGIKKRVDIDFSIIKKRLEVQFSLKRKLSLKYFRDIAKAKPSAANTFALALALSRTHHYSESIKHFSELPAKWRNHLMVKLSVAQVHTAHLHPEKARIILSSLDKIYPNNSAIQLISANNLLAANHPQGAVKILKSLTAQYPENADAWYLLAEAQGLAGNTLALHIARIEYFQLTAQLKRAKQQLSFARRARKLTQAQRFLLDDLEVYIDQVEGYSKTKY